MCLLQNFANTVQFCASTTRLKKILTSNDQVLYAFLDITGAFTQRCFFSNFNTDVCTLHTGAFTQRCFTRKYLYAQVLVHRDAFTNRNFYTQTHRYFYTLHTDVFAQRCFYAGMLLHTRTFTQGFFWHRVALTLMKRLHKSAYTEMFLHNRNTFIQRRFLHTDTYTTSTQRCFYTQVFVHTNTFTHCFYIRHTSSFTQIFFTRKHFYTEILWHTVTGAFTRRWCLFYTFTLHRFSHTYALSQGCHRDAFTQGCFHTQKCFYTHTQSLLHRDDFTLSNFTHRCQNKQFFFFTKEWIYTRSFCLRSFLHRHTLTWLPTADVHLARKSSANIWISPQHVRIETHFVGKGWPSTNPLGLRERSWYPPAFLHLPLYTCM